MGEMERYLFDLTGYLVIEGILTPGEVRMANKAIDRHQEQIRVRPQEQSLAGGSPTLRGEFGRGELGGMLEWEEPWCLPFRGLIAHPRLVPYLNALLGFGFRMDHCMTLITMEKGAEGFRFHGSSGPGFDPNQYYIVRDGRMHNGLTVVTVQLTDVNPGDGGFALIPGSHKCNFVCPPALLRYEALQDQVRQIACPAGSAVIFTEAVTHGTLPWVADHPRRSLLTRYTAGNMAYVPSYPVPAWANERQRAVMEPPYHARLQRPILTE
jgi:hypothetical protein